MRTLLGSAVLGLLFAFLPATASTAFACSSAVAQLRSNYVPNGFRDLCELADRYAAAHTALLSDGFSDPDRIADYLAPRFIGPSDWTAGRVSFRYQPAWIYHPYGAPASTTTWTSWERGNQLIKDQSNLAVANGNWVPASVEWLQSIHRAVMTGLPIPSAPGVVSGPGEFRFNVDEVGIATDTARAPSRHDIELTRSPDFIAGRHQALIDWQPTQCDGRTEAPFSTARDDAYFTGSDGQLHQCGYFKYLTKSGDIPKVLRQAFDDLNQNLARANDPIAAAARVERWIVATHPFTDGNGRTARLVMDWVLETHGLPAPVLENMDLDTVTTEADWSRQVGEGLGRAVKTLESCVADPDQQGCDEVDLTPSAASPFDQSTPNCTAPQKLHLAAIFSVDLRAFGRTEPMVASEDWFEVAHPRHVHVGAKIRVKASMKDALRVAWGPELVAAAEAELPVLDVSTQYLCK